MEERRNFSNLILDFVLGKVKEDKFRFVVEKRIEAVCQALACVYRAFQIEAGAVESLEVRIG